jgi:hypothetical protein
MSTVVPDGNLNKWDAPMPPAKIIFQIQAGTPANVAGYFKSAMKGDIYYINEPDNVTAYTNPFYQEMIPAHEAIPVFINNGGYDWNSFNVSYGPYPFWKMINQHTNLPLVPTTDPSGHPTNAEVYSDNHGEAMIWLNGNWNLNLGKFMGKTNGVDVYDGATVGTTTIQATADYPYSRVHQALQSNKDIKTWLWGGQILGTDGHQYPVLTTPTDSTQTRTILSAGTWDPTTLQGGTYDYNTNTPSSQNEQARSLDKVVFVWITDRDGRQNGVMDAKITWRLTADNGSGGGHIPDLTGVGISSFNNITRHITLTHGFLTGTDGVIVSDLGTSVIATSHVIPVTAGSYLEQLFNKFYGPTGTSSIKGVATNYVVAAIDVQSNSADYTAVVNVEEDITSADFYQFNNTVTPAATGTVIYYTTIYYSATHPLDDGIKIGDANCDGVVNMGDVTAVERMILGYNKVTSNAVVNGDGTVDMGTVVKIERTILGLN